MNIVNIEKARKDTPEYWIVLLFLGLEIIYPMFSTLNISSMSIFLVRIALVFSTLFILIIKYSRGLSRKPIPVFLLWAVYVVLKNLILGYGWWTSPVQMISAIIPSAIAVVATVYALLFNERKTTTGIIVALYIYIIYSLISFGEGISVTADSERLGGEELNANTIGIRAGLIFFFVVAKYFRNSIGLTTFMVLLIVPTIVVILSGSRTGLGIAVIALSVLAFKSGKGLRYSFSRLVFLAIAIVGGWALFNYTGLGQRVLNTSDQAERLGYIQTGTFWDEFGDRGYMYYNALPYIPKHFWFGIGSGNYQSQIPNAIWVLHSEYLIQILECGFFSALLYYSVYYWIIKRTRAIKTNNAIEKNIKRLCIFGFIALFFVGFVTRVSYYGMYSCVLGYFIYNVYNQKRISI